MTYALLKCLLLAGVDVKDPRVVAALGWITQNFSLDRNPGFEGAADPEKAGQQGWYYYVYTLARTLAEYERITQKPLVVKDNRVLDPKKAPKRPAPEIPSIFLWQKRLAPRPPSSR